MSIGCHLSAIPILPAAAGLAAGLLFAALSTMSLWPLLRTGRRDEGLASLVFAFLGVQVAMVVVPGLLGVFRGPFLGAFSAAGAAVLLGVPAPRRRIRACLDELILPLARELPRAAAAHPLLALAWAAFGAFLLLRAWMFVLLMPPTSFDTLTYHLPKVAQWVQTGSLRLPDLPIKRVFWPSGSECLNAWWAVFPHSDLLVNVPGHFSLALVALASHAMARSAGVSRAGAAWCALAAALVPAYAVHAATCLNDLPVAAGFLYLAALWSRPAAGEEEARTRWALSAAAACLTVGAKPTLAFLSPGILLLVALHARRSDALALRRCLRAPPGAWALVAAAAFLGSYWYLHNWVRFGSPLYPVVLGENSEDGIQSGTFSLGALRTALGMLVSGGILDGRPVIANLFMMTGWGWFAVVCGVPASAAAALLSRRYRTILAAFALSAACVLGSVVPDFSCLRFLMFFPPVLCVGFFAFLETARPPKAVRAALAALAAWTVALCAGSALTNAAAIDWAKLRGHPRSVLSNQRPLWLRILRKIPEDAPVAACLWREDPLYLLYGPRFTRRIETLEELGEGEGVADWMDARGVRHLFFPRWEDWNPDMGDAVRRDLGAGRLEHVGMGIFVRTDGEPGEETP